MASRAITSAYPSSQACRAVASTPDVGGDNRRERSYSTPRRLSSEIEVGAEEGAPGRLGDENVAGLGKAGREVDETCRQVLGSAVGSSTCRSGPIKFWHGVHQHHGRPGGAKLCRQRLAPRRPVRRRKPAEVSCPESRFAGRSARARSFLVECDHWLAPRMLKGCAK